MVDKEMTMLLKTHHKEAYLWAYQCCHYNEEEAKDVLQLVYLKIIEGKAIYKKQSAFKTWLFSVIKFTALDALKKQQKLVSMEGIEIVSTETEFKLEQDEVNYSELLQKLPKQQQHILTLVFYHHMTLAEIATVEKLHIGTVRTHYERGKKALRNLLKLPMYEK